jgi:hypothetical protein
MTAPQKDSLAILKHAAFLARVRGQDKVAAELEKHAAIIEKCPADKRNAVAAALRILQPKYLALPEGRVVDSVATGYPLARREQTARIILGESPTKIAPGLTRTEAHEWLSEHPYRKPSEWLLTREFNEPDVRARVDPARASWGSRPCGLGTKRGGEIANSVQHVEVARWILKMLSKKPTRDALCRQRVVRGPHGEEIHGSYWDRVDEIRPSDLRDSVDDTFNRAMARMQKSTERLLAKDTTPLAAPPAWWKPARCAKVLLKASELMVEGKQMQHCVAGYAGYVKKGESVIVRLEVPERKEGKTETHRSTVELDRRTGRILQHRGPRNRDPHPINVKALKVLMRRWQNEGGR